MNSCLDSASSRAHANTRGLHPIRVAVVRDLTEENWPSMDLVGEMLCSTLNVDHKDESAATGICPKVPPSLQIAPLRLRRVLGRFIVYPRALKQIRNDYDIFHIADHSYAHLVHSLPAGRTVITCHDLDTFRCLIHPLQEKRSFAFRAMSGHILSGMQKAAHVTCDSCATRDDILQHKLVSDNRLTVVPNGVHPAFGPTADPVADGELSRLLKRAPNTVPELLHVGSVIPRKRIDVLLRVFANLRRVHPQLRLLRIGGAFTSAHEQLACLLGVRCSIDVLPHLAPKVLAAAYRRAALLLQPSEAEGFGLPVVESLACATPVLASDIRSLREVGGNAAAYCPVANISAWTSSALALLASIQHPQLLIAQAQRFVWSEYASAMLRIYSKVLCL